MVPDIGLGALPELAMVVPEDAGVKGVDLSTGIFHAIANIKAAILWHGSFIALISRPGGFPQPFGCSFSDGPQVVTIPQSIAISSSGTKSDEPFRRGHGREGVAV